jgi:hypothetical protein
MDQYRMLRLVVAAPDDVKPERDVVPGIIEELNRNIAHKEGLHLELYRWETDAHPGFHPLGPQGLIDPKLKIEDCDLLIGIFWKRFGTPVSDAKSGTEHEFRIAYEAWEKKKRPQIFIYFSHKAYAPKSKEEADQVYRVFQFTEDFPKEGLWWNYKNKPEFEAYLRNHLTQFLQEQSPTDDKSHAAASAVVIPTVFEFPSPPDDFFGREAELHDLREALESSVVQAVGLQGQKGTGKTALALKLADDLAPNFPYAQIYVDLKGASATPLTAAQALARIMKSFDPDLTIPESETALRSLFTSALFGKRAILLLDDASDAAQVEPLVPPQGSVMIVTSRKPIPLGGLMQLTLGPLPDLQRLDRQDFEIRFDPSLSKEQITATLNALADYFRACGGIGLNSDFEIADVFVGDPEDALV